MGSMELECGRHKNCTREKWKFAWFLLSASCFLNHQNLLLNRNKYTMKCSVLERRGWRSGLAQACIPSLLTSCGSSGILKMTRMPRLGKGASPSFGFHHMIPLIFSTLDSCQKGSMHLFHVWKEEDHCDWNFCYLICLLLRTALLR